MPKPDVLMLVLAGGKGARLDLLTKDRAKPAVPFAGMYRLIDFPLSNCLHSQVSDVWVMQQYQPASLNDHLANGRPWDLDRTTGGLLVLPPYQGTPREGWTQGTADGLWRNAELIRQVDPRIVVMVSADAVYRLNYRELVEAHWDAGAVATMVTTRVEAHDADRYGVVQVADDRVVDYQYKPDDPKSDVISNEVFAFEPAPVLTLLDELAEQAGDDGLEDLGDQLWPRLVNDEPVLAYRQPGYWRDVGTVDAYWSANMDFLADDPPLELDDPQWPIRTQGGHRAPAWITDSGAVHRSLVSAAARIAGEVVHSVLSPGVVVERDAYVEDSVLLPGVVVRRGARVIRSVLDDSVEVGADAEVGGADAIAMLGRQAHLPAGSRIPAGGRFPD
ncbi:MAG TPA: sugar phosphate nucleotidyltransferase [Jatrophihabitans sp.]|nr:sugar phosphate nucleotidyltransferase [Jatrophihabitans sp.]